MWAQVDSAAVETPKAVPELPLAELEQGKSESESESKKEVK